jgi:hypothetical protein
MKKVELQIQYYYATITSPKAINVNNMIDVIFHNLHAAAPTPTLTDAFNWFIRDSIFFV